MVLVGICLRVADHAEVQTVGMSKTTYASAVSKVVKLLRIPKLLSMCTSVYIIFIHTRIKHMLCINKSRFIYVCNKTTHTYTQQYHNPGVREKTTSGEEITLEYWLSEHQIRGWRAVSAAGLQGKGLHKRSVFYRPVK